MIDPALESIRRLSQFNLAYANRMRKVEPPLCDRTLALYKPGTQMPCVHCSFYYTGKMPCTGRLVCHLCGKGKQ